MNREVLAESETPKRGNLLPLLLALLCALLVLWPRPAAAAAAPLSPAAEDPPELPEETDRAAGDPAPQFSQPSGIYDAEELTVELTAPAGYTLAYTTDGSAPTPEDDCGDSHVSVRLEPRGEETLIEQRKRFLCPLDTPMLQDPELPRGRVLRAALLDPDGQLLAPETRVYFLGTDLAARYPGCMILSVCTDPENLLDPERGILATGAVYEAWAESEAGRESLSLKQWWLYESNATQRGRDWERPCRIQIYDGGSRPAAELDAGMRVTGGASRRMSQKSFNFYFREEYGRSLLPYELFPGVGRYKSFTLRSGGNNTEGLKFKDCFLQSLVTDRALTVPQSRPAVLFLNGEYWGPYMLREKVSPQMLQDLYRIDPGQVIVVKNGELEAGLPEDLESYRELAAFAREDFRDPEVYRRFCEIMDVESFADYCALRIYIGDGDWAWETNEILWRTRDGSFREGRWFFVLHDIGCSAGLYGDGTTAADTDHIARAIGNHPLFAAALASPDFRARFLRSLRELGEENLAPARVEEALRSWEEDWQPLLPDYYRRYAVPPADWAVGRDTTLDFFRRRGQTILPCYLLHLLERDWNDGDIPPAGKENP